MANCYTLKLYYLNLHCVLEKEAEALKIRKVDFNKTRVCHNSPLRIHIHLKEQLVLYFVPFGVEMYEALGSSPLTLLQDLSKKLRETTGDARASVFLRQNISLAIQRDNAASVIATSEEGEKLRFCGR
ncbi:hypothetical protein ACOME3_008147 [Neoechinorhynchus agilis]